MQVNDYVSDSAVNDYGWIHVGPNQTVGIVKTAFYIPAHIRVYAGGEIRLPAASKLHGNDMLLEGRLEGVRPTLGVSVHAEPWCRLEHSGGRVSCCAAGVLV